MTVVARRGLRWGDWVFAAFMLALAVLCVFLGTWQVHRLAEKEALIAAVDQRLHADPIAVPPSSAWAGLDLSQVNFQPVSLTGHYEDDQTVTVFTSLGEARGQFSGPGYWVVTPFVLTGGGTVFVNRGFVPQDKQEAAILGQLFSGDDTQKTITGLLREGEHAGWFVPEADMSDRIEWVRDPGRLAKMVDPALGPFAPFYVDLPSGLPGQLPQGGETVVSFPNNHFGYALTWYGFAMVAVVMLIFWLWRQARRPMPNS